MKSHLSTLFLCLDSPIQFIIQDMRIVFHIHGITDAIQMAHNVNSCGDTGKHSYTLQSLRLNRSDEETSGDYSRSMQTFPCTEFGMTCARVGRIPGSLEDTNLAPVNRQDLPSRLNDCSVQR